MSTPYTELDVPPGCQRAREAFGLKLIGEPVADADALRHPETCEACTRIIARMARVWDVAGDVLPDLQPLPEARFEAVLENVLADSRQENRTPEAAPSTTAIPVATPHNVVPLRRAREERDRTGFRFAVGLALAAGLAAFALLGPGLLSAPAPSGQVAEEAPIEPVRVTLAAAKGDVSFVPADGRVVAAPKRGETLGPGLFAATGGAALDVPGGGLLAVRGDTTVVIGGGSAVPEISIARGEIFVDLPKGSVQGFTVRTPTGAVRVTGTRFDVKVAPDATRVEVTRGSVVLAGPNGETSVAAGEAASLGRDGAPVEVEIADPARDPLRWVRDLAPDRVGPAPLAIAPVQPRPTATAADEPIEEVIYAAGLDKLVVENALAKRRAAMRYCYEQALVRTPGLGELRASLRFRVDEQGRAEDLRIAGLPADQQELGACLRTAAESAVFPPTSPGTEVRVRYPVRLQPAD